MLRVAIVEDDPTLMEALVAEINEAEGMSVANRAEDFVEAKGLVEAGGYDVLLCDLGLPNGDGVDLIKQEALTGRDTDIIVITQFADHKKVLESIKAGARGYLLKDARNTKCVDAIREIHSGGSPISPIIARQLVHELAQPKKLKTPISPLSERESEVLNLLARGFSYIECSQILHVSSNTIGFHVKNIYRKLEVNSRAEALFEASSQGILRY